MFYAFMIVVIVEAWMSGCVSSQYQVKKIDTTLDVKGQVDNKKMGLDKDNVIILQEENDGADELRQQKSNNLDSKVILDREVGILNRCRTELADPRLAGPGKKPEYLDVSDMKAKVAVEEELGLNNGDVKVVRKTKYLDELRTERKYWNSLQAMLKQVQRQNEQCAYALGQARVKVGLPAERYNGLLTGGRHENSLDDAFEIKASKEAAKKAAVRPQEESKPASQYTKVGVDEYGNIISGGDL